MGNFRNLAALAALAVFAPAWPATAPTAAILACTKVTEDPARLACFDRQAAALSALQAGSADRAGATAAAAPGNTDSSSTKLTPEQKMGLPRGKVDALEAAPGAAPEPQLKDFTAAIRSVSAGGNGRQVFELDNNQVWRQAETKPKFEVHPGDTVRISKGALGSFWLSANVHSATRVSRVR